MSSDAKLYNDALLYHSQPTPGKISVVPTKKHTTQRDLALAYSPGVAAPCLEIEKNPHDAYKYTSKGNLVAVISNGTAVLGLGDIGALAGKPVMEGKGLLFKIFADIDVFDIEIDEKDPEKFIQTVKNIAPTFGGINLEDIKAPESFEIEKRLVAELDIPVMHDDQHGTAIISAAALLNALELADKQIDQIKLVVSGAGSAALASANLYVLLGVKVENIIMFDVNGVLSSERTDLSDLQKKYALAKPGITLSEAIVGADVFLGLSAGNVLKPEMLLTMAPDPIVFAMANPTPEIDYNLAISTRKDVIMATGRSDYPNQVNNVLGFPYIFRGALDVRATKINEEMKMAAVKALAGLAKEHVPEQVNIAYGEKHLSFGREYILPKPFDTRLIEVIPVAVAQAAIASGVALEPIEDWEKYRDQLAERLGSGSKWMKQLVNRAKENPKRVVFAEADQLDVLKAAQIVYEEGIAIPILLGNKDLIYELMSEISFDAPEGVIMVIDPKGDEQKEKRSQYAYEYWLKRQRKGVKLFDAESIMNERNYYGAMMVMQHDADAFISGFTRSYANVVKPIIEIVGRKTDCRKVSATNLMLTSKGPLFLSDTAVNIDPSAEDLACISHMTAEMMRMLGMQPVMALLSYSNFGTSNHELSTKVSQAVKFLHEHFPDLLVDGEIQADFALNQDMRQDRFPFSKIEGKKVNALIFPGLSSANIAYKIMKEQHDVASVGPILMGLSEPVHIVQMRATVDEIVNMTTIAVIDAIDRQRVKV
jgi:malate dehydrogenase (oxaloacetate-decarboxylating)(NADP+)